MNRPDSHPEHVTPYDRFALSDSQIECLLANGDQQRELLAYFGKEEYRELSRLAKLGQAAATADAPRVFIVPGIMGSQLGLLRPAPLPNDVLWLDPIDIEVGRLAALRLPDAAPVVSLGTVLYSYLRLKLHLRAAGFAPDFHDYDWRLGIDELGEKFAERLRAAKGNRLMVVAHSMGGLVSRAALALPGTEHVERVVLMGTPNFGSFAPVQALRGTYAVVRKIARLVKTSSAETLAAEVFNTFPSLYHLLPISGCHGGPDLLDESEWPRSDPRPLPQLLATAHSVRAALGPPDHRFAVVVGVGQETVTAVERRKDEFVYTITRHGDGTVPAVSAELPGAVTHYAKVAHSDLTRNPRVAAAVIDLLRKGTTRRLPTKWESRSRAEARITDRQLRRTHVQKVDWAALEPEQRRIFLQNLNEPPKLRLRVPAKNAQAAGRKPETEKLDRKKHPDQKAVGKKPDSKKAEREKALDRRPAGRKATGQQPPGKVLPPRSKARRTARPK